MKSATTLYCSVILVEMVSVLQLEKEKVLSSAISIAAQISTLWTVHVVELVVLSFMFMN